MLHVRRVSLSAYLPREQPIFIDSMATTLDRGHPVLPFRHESNYGIPYRTRFLTLLTMPRETEVSPLTTIYALERMQFRRHEPAELRTFGHPGTMNGSLWDAPFECQRGPRQYDALRERAAALNEIVPTRDKRPSKGA